MTDDLALDPGNPPIPDDGNPVDSPDGNPPLIVSGINTLSGYPKTMLRWSVAAQLCYRQIHSPNNITPSEVLLWQRLNR